MDLSTQPAPALFQPTVSVGSFFNFDFHNHTNMAARRQSLAANNLPFYCSRRPELHTHPVDDVRSRLLSSVYLNHAPRMVIRPKAIRLPFIGGYTGQKAPDTDFLRRSPFSRSCPGYSPYSTKTLLSNGEALRLCSVPANYAEEFRSRTPTGGIRVSVSPGDNGKIFAVDASFDSAHFAENTEKELQVTKRHNSLDFDNVLLFQQQQQQQQHEQQPQQRFALDMGFPLSLTLCKAKSDIDVPSKENVPTNKCKDKKQFEFLKSDHLSGDTIGLKGTEMNIYPNNSSSTLEKLNPNNVRVAFRRKVIDKRTFSYKSRRTNKSFKNHRISPSSRLRSSKIRNSSNKIRTSSLSSHNRQEGEMYDNTSTTICKQTENRNRRKAGEPPTKDNEDVWDDNDLNLLPPQNQAQTTTVSSSDPGENTATSSNLGSQPYTKTSDTRSDNPLSVPFSLPLSCLGGDRKSFCCPQCRYLTDRKNNLKRHIVTMHQESGKILECCGVAFQSKAALRDHNAIFHRGGYRCQICSRNFCRKALLRRHLTVHSGQKDFFCDLCGYATSHKSNLERHQKVHSKREGTLVLGDGERPFKKNVNKTSRDPFKTNNSNNTYRSNGNRHCCNGNNNDSTIYNNSSNNSNNNSCNNNINNYKSDGLNMFAQVNFNNNLLLEPQDFSTAELFPTLGDLDQEDRLTTTASRGPNELENQDVNDDARSNDVVIPEDVPASLNSHRYRPRKGGMLRSRLAETYRDNDWFVKGNVGTDIDKNIGNDGIIPKVEQHFVESENDTSTKLPQSKEERCVAAVEENEKNNGNIPDGLRVSSVIDYKNQEPNILELKRETNESQHRRGFHLKSLKRKRLCPLAYECATCHRKFQCQVTLESHECQRLLCDSAVNIPLVTSVRRGTLSSLQ